MQLGASGGAGRVLTVFPWCSLAFKNVLFLCSLELLYSTVLFLYHLGLSALFFSC